MARTAWAAAGAALLCGWAWGPVFAQAQQAQAQGVTFADTAPLAVAPNMTKNVIVVNGSSTRADLTVIIDGVSSEVVAPGPPPAAPLAAPALTLGCPAAARSVLAGIDGCRFGSVAAGQGVSVTVTSKDVAKSSSATIVAVGSDGSLTRRSLTIAPLAATPETPPAELVLRTDDDTLCELFPTDFVGGDTEHTVFAKGPRGLARIVVSRTSEVAGCHLNRLPEPALGSPQSSSTTVAAIKAESPPEDRTTWTRFAGTFEDIGSFSGTWDTNGAAAMGGELKLIVQRTSSGWSALVYLALGSAVASVLAFAGGRGRAVFTQRSAQKRKQADAVRAAGTDALMAKLSLLRQGPAPPLSPDAVASIEVEWTYPPTPGQGGRAAEDLVSRHASVNRTTLDLIFASSDVFIDGATFKRFADGCDAWVSACTAAGVLSDTFCGLPPTDRQQPLGAATLAAFASGPPSLDKPTVITVAADTAANAADLLREIDRASAEAADAAWLPNREEIMALLADAREALTAVTDLAVAIPPAVRSNLYQAIALFCAPSEGDAVVASAFEPAVLKLSSTLARVMPDMTTSNDGTDGGAMVVQVSVPPPPPAPPASSAELAKLDAEAARAREIAYVVVYTIVVFAVGVLVGWVTSYIGKDVWGSTADKWTAFTWALGSAAVLQIARYVDLAPKPAKAAKAE